MPHGLTGLENTLSFKEKKAKKKKALFIVSGVSVQERSLYSIAAGLLLKWAKYSRAQ